MKNFIYRNAWLQKKLIGLCLSMSSLLVKDSKAELIDSIHHNTAGGYYPEWEANKRSSFSVKCRGCGQWTNPMYPAKHYLLLEDIRDAINEPIPESLTDDIRFFQCGRCGCHNFFVDVGITVVPIHTCLNEHQVRDLVVYVDKFLNKELASLYAEQGATGPAGVSGYSGKGIGGFGGSN